MKRLPTLASVNDRRPMTEDESKMYITMTLAEMGHAPIADPVKARDLANVVSEFVGRPVEESFATSVFIKRLEAGGLDLEYNPIMVVFLAGISENVASVVMWAYFLVEETKRLGRAFNSTDFADIFPMGLPTTEAIHEYWDSQKIDSNTEGQDSIFGWPSDNWLDLKEAWRGEPVDAVV